MKRNWLLIVILVLAVGCFTTFTCFAPVRTDTLEVTGISILRGNTTLYNVTLSGSFAGALDLNDLLDIDATSTELYAANIKTTGSGGALFVDSWSTGNIATFADSETTFFGFEDGCAKSDTWNPDSMDDGTVQTKSITVTGAALGDFVLVSAPYDLELVTATAYVQAINTVYVLLSNQSGGAVDLGSGTWRVLNIASH